MTDPLAGLSMRLPPQNLEAEQALLGAILANNRAYDRCAEFLRADHFADPVHAEIWQAIDARINRGQVVDAVSLRAALQNSARLAEVGGAGYLGQLVAASVSIVNAVDYARAIADCWARREAIAALADGLEALFAPPPDRATPDTLDAVEQALFRIAGGSGVHPPPVAAHAAARAAVAMGLAARRGLSGVASGIAGIDRHVRGFKPGNLYVIAARPGMGKSALAGTIAARAAAGGARVLFVSLEMSAEQLGARLCAAQSGLPIAAVETAGRFENDPHSGRFRFIPNGDAEAARIERACADLEALPLAIDVTPDLSIAKLRARVRRQARRAGCDLVIIDYLHLMRASDGARRSGSRVHEIAELSRELKILAGEMAVPIIALSQLNRESEKRDNHRPTLADLRDGPVEQDAEVVIALYRAEEYLARNEPERREKETREQFLARQQAWNEAMDQARGRAEAILLKNRQGPQKTLGLKFIGEGAFFLDESEPSDTPLFTPPLPPEGA